MEILGDFSPFALTLRLLAPNPEALLTHWPDADETRRFSNWEDYRRTVRFEDDPTPLLYAGNFFHELVHLFQSTTRYQVIWYSQVLRQFSMHTFQVATDLIASAGPPRLPLARWFNEHLDKETAKGWYAGFAVARAVSAFETGDEEILNEIAAAGDQPIEEVFPVPYNPSFAHLERDSESAFHEFDNTPITTRLLLESEATILEYRFLSLYYGEELARYLLGANNGGPLRPDYDYLTVTAAADGLLYLAPLLIDWAFQGPHFDQVPTRIGPDQQKDLIPTWRFVSLYRAARRFRGISLNDLWNHFDDVEKVIHDSAGLRCASSEIPKTVLWIRDRERGVFRRIYANNLRIRRKEPKAFAFLEVNYTPLVARSYVPFVLFRDSPFHAWHPGRKLSDLNLYQIERIAHRVYEVTRMLATNSIACPFCSSTGGLPNVGRVGFVTDAVRASEKCFCGWSVDFSHSWGVSPDAILQYDH